MIGLALSKKRPFNVEDVLENNPPKKTKIYDSKAEKRRKREELFHREVEVITKDDDFPMPDEEHGNAFLVGICGRRKCGKTFFADKLLKTIWKGLFDKIYVLSRTAKKQPKYFGTWGGNIVFIEEWDESFFQKVVEELEHNKNDKYLIFIDDMANSMREKLYESQIDDFSFIGRHSRLSICWLIQKITLSTPGFRQEADAFINFREENMQELRLLHREWGYGDLDDFITPLLEHTKEPYSWIMIRNIQGNIHIMRPPNEEEQKLLWGPK